MGFLQNLIAATTPKPNPNNLFMGPAPAQPTMPNPQAALGALGQALAQSQKQRQAASQAGSALAHKSHPQTLPGAQPAQPQNPAATAPAPTTPQPPSAQLQGQIDNLNKQQATNLQNQQQAINDYKAAMQTPIPDAPQYQQAQMQGPNTGLALGAALAALVAPKVSQGAIGALGVDQTNREAEYKRADEANQNQYKAQSGQYDSAISNRESKIKDAEGLANLDDRLVTSGNNQIDSLTRAEVNAEEAEARERETIANHARLEHAREVKQTQWATHEENNQAWRKTLAEHQAAVLGIDRSRLHVLQGTLDLGNRRLGQQLTEFGVSQHNIAVLQGIRTTAQLAAMYDRDEQGDKRDSVRAMSQGLHDINNQITQLATHSQGPQAAAAIAKLQAYADPKTAEGQRMESAMKMLGTSGSAIGTLFDEETGVDNAIGTSLTAGTDAATPAPTGTPNPNATGAPGAAVTNITNNYGGSDPALGNPAGDPIERARQFVQQAGGNMSGLQSVDGKGHVTQAAATPVNDPKVEYFNKLYTRDLSDATSNYKQALAVTKNPETAWRALMPHITKDPNISDHDFQRELHMIRRTLMGGGNGGARQAGNVQAP